MSGTKIRDKQSVGIFKTAKFEKMKMFFIDSSKNIYRKKDSFFETKNFQKSWLLMLIALGVTKWFNVGKISCLNSAGKGTEKGGEFLFGVLTVGGHSLDLT